MGKKPNIKRRTYSPFTVNKLEEGINTNQSHTPDHKQYCKEDLENHFENKYMKAERDNEIEKEKQYSYTYTKSQPPRKKTPTKEIETKTNQYTFRKSLGPQKNRPYN